jgi:DNA-binding NarL/FixJ family response regulator
MKQTRVLVADDHALIRAGLRALLHSLPGVQVVAEAGDGIDALRQIRQHQPEVVLIESGISKLNGFEVTARVSKECPKVHVMILSADADENLLKRAFNCGAAGYLVMTASALELELAVKSIASGETHVTPSATKSPVGSVRHRVVDETFGPLTPRQREVLRLIGKGFSTKQIALFLNISVKTVETHRMLLTDRLHIHNTAGLVRYAIRNGLVGLEDSQAA